MGKGATVPMQTSLPKAAAELLEQREFGLLIGGRQRTAGDGSTRDVIDPSTEQVIARVPEATPQDVADAVDAARRAQPAWAALGLRGRADVFEEIARRVVEHREEFAILDAVDAGNPIRAMRKDLEHAVQSIRDWPRLALSMQGATIPASVGNLHYTTHEPYGVVGRILAFNHPALFAITRILAALVVGNTVVVKPAAQTPLSALAFGATIADVVPEGVVNVVSGGAATGDAITTHPIVKRIGFTGSLATGLLIQKRAATVGAKHVSLELGGKNAMIVFPDADLEQAVAGARKGMNFEACQGQSCGSTSRIFVHDSLHDEFVDRYAASVEEITVGPAYNDGSQMGPVISDAHHERVSSYIRSARDDGARLVTGGGRPATLDTQLGYFLAPTIFSEVRPEMPVAREEVFGPVSSILRWSDYEAVLEQANAVEYGLTASIWTNNLHAAHATAHRLNAGYIWINDTTTHYWGTPFGGFKNSGVGREESVEELYSYCEQKVVHTILDDSTEAFGLRV